MSMAADNESRKAERSFTAFRMTGGKVQDDRGLFGVADICAVKIMFEYSNKS